MFFSAIVIERFLNILVIFLIASFLFWMLDFFLRRFSKAMHRESGNEDADHRVHTVTTLVRAIGLAVIFFIGGSMSLKVLQIDIAPILAGAGILGVMASLSAQAVVKDVLAGLFILLENQYSPGMLVKLDDVKGMVEHVSLRQTVLKDDEGNTTYVPNGGIKVVTIMTVKKKRT